MQRSVEDDGPSVFSIRRLERANTTKQPTLFGDMKSTKYNFLHQLAERKRHNPHASPTKE